MRERGGATILVIDDERDVREALRLVLELEGFDVRTAPNGREALRLLAGGLVPSLILLDLMMPVMNGPEFVTRMRADPALRRLPVVVITAFSRMVQDLRARGIEIQGMVEKPVDVEVLLGHIRRHCPGLEVVEHGGAGPQV